MAKHDDFDDFFGDDDTPPVADTRADGRLYRVPITRLAANRVNPRKDFGTKEALIDFGKSLKRRQNQPCPVVSRAAYLKLWPDHSEYVGDVDYVLVSGERRFRAGLLVDLPALNCVVDDGFAASRKVFMEAVVSENVDRQNFDPIEEAYAVQALVTEFGSNRAVAQHFERADGWVTQRVLLTHLAHETQDLVRKKVIPIEAARSLGKQARDNDWGAAEQLEWWEGEQQRRTAASAARAAAKKAAKEQPAQPVQAAPALERVVPETPSGTSHEPPSPVPARFTAVKPEATLEPERSVEPSGPPPALPRSVPKPASEMLRSSTAEQPAVREPGLPYEDGPAMGRHLIATMSEEALEELLPVLQRHRDKRVAAAS